VVTAIADILKELYSDEEIAFETLDDNPLLGVLEKDESGGGNEFVNFLTTGSNNSGSGDFATSVANSGAPPTSGFKLPWGQQYTTPQISNKLMKQTANDADAFTKALKLMIDGALNEGSYSLSATIAGNGTGIRGTVKAGSNLNGGQVILTDPEQVVNFQQGQWIQFAFVQGATYQLRNATPGIQITGLDETSGILTFSGVTLTTTYNVAVTDIIIRAGDMYAGTAYNNGCGTTAANPLFAGLGGWFPIVRPQPGTGDSFGGVDRSGSTSRLAGVYIDGTRLSPIEGLNKLISRTERQKGKPGYAVTNHFNYERFANSITGQARYEPVEAFDNADITYDLLTMKLGGRDVRLIKERTLSSAVCYALTLDTLCLRSMGKSNAVLEYDMYGQAVLPIATADGIQVRVGGYPVLSCRAPAWNGVLQLQ
jgi:hypothetical protein